MSPRILFLDIETAPIIMAAWTLYEANAVYVLRDTYIISVAHRWMGEKRTSAKLLPDFPRYKKLPHCDRDLCGHVWKLLDEADIVVAHNGDAFDVKKINSRLIVHGHEPPSTYKTIDTLKGARKTFKFDSNKLDNIGRYLGEGQKLPNTGAALWRACCEDGDPKAWRAMGRYNRRDVDLLVAAYERLKPWMTNHPNLAAYGTGFGCPVCASTNVQARGFNVAKTRKTQRLQCRECAHWFSAPLRSSNPQSAPRRAAGRTGAARRTAHAGTEKKGTAGSHRLRPRLPKQRIRGRH